MRGWNGASSASKETKMAEEVPPFEIYPGQIEAYPEIAHLLGLFVARWSFAEYSLMLAFLVALDSRQQEVATTVLASATSAEAKIQIVLKTLGVAKLPDVRRNTIRTAVRALDKLCPERNALMHHLWGRRSTGEIITINFREANPTKAQTIRTPASIKALVNAVVDAAYGISKATGSTWIDESAAAQLKV
jgi:hypothetical protein